jgi:hypothetical protein
MDPIVELVQQLEPETAAPSESIEARQRDALMRSMVNADRARTRPARGRPARHKRWLLVIVGAAAAAVLAAILVSGSSSPPRPPAATSIVLTAVRRALVNTSDDIEEVRSTLPGVVALSTTSWVDLATGACRTDTSVNGKPSLTLFVEHGRAVVIDHGDRQWWTRAAGGVSCEPLTPQTIEHDLSTGDYMLAGHATVDGQPSLKLVTTMMTTGLHPVTKVSTLWVNATTYLPIQSTSTGHLTERTAFTWLPTTATNTATLKISIPGGFRQVATPPTGP